MADMTITSTLDDRDFKRGLDRMLADSKRVRGDLMAGVGVWGNAIGGGGGAGGRGSVARGAAAEQEKTNKFISMGLRTAVAMRAVRAATAYAGEAVDLYASKSEDAARICAKWEEETQVLKMSIGRDLVGAMDSWGGTIKGVLGWVDKLRGSAVNGLTNLFGGDGAGVDAANKDKEAAEKAMAETVKYAKAQKELNALLADYDSQNRRTLVGLNDLSAVEAEVMGFEEERRKAHAKVDEGVATLGPGQTQALADARDSKRLIDYTADERIAAVRKKQLDKEMQVGIDLQLEKNAAREGIKADERHLEIAVLRLEKQSTLADQKELEYKYSAMIADLEANALLSAEEKEAALQRINELRGRELRAIGAPDTPRQGGVRTLAPGLAPGLVSQVFGGGGGNPGQTAVVSSEKHLRGIAAELGAIARKISGGLTSVYG